MTNRSPGLRNKFELFTGELVELVLQVGWKNKLQQLDLCLVANLHPGKLKHCSAQVSGVYP